MSAGAMATKVARRVARVFFRESSEPREVWLTEADLARLLALAVEAGALEARAEVAERRGGAACD